MTLSLENGADLLRRVREAINGVVMGQEHAIDDALITFLARGHLLIEGVPGTAKTLIVRTLASSLGLDFKRIQFTPDLMPADITGISVITDPGRGFEFCPGPIFTQILLGDEINRAPAKTQAALLEAMAEGQVTTDGVSRPLDPLFTVFATQNPVEHEGTYPLPEAQLDRFLLKTVVGYPSLDAEREMLARHEDGFDPESATQPLVNPLIDEQTALALRTLVNTVRVAPEVRDYIAAITRATREEPALSLGGSPRASIALMRAARATAVLEKRPFVTPDDVKECAHAALRHRVTLSPELEVEGRSADDALSAILQRVDVPK